MQRGLIAFPSNPTRLFALFLFCLFISNLPILRIAHAQDLEMRRSNTVGNWIGHLNNNGSLFNQTDSNHLPIFGLGAGGVWTGLGRFDTVVFGAGLWFGGLRDSAGIMVP